MLKDPRRAVLIAVAAGGAFGAPARFEVTELIHVAKGTFPWGTFGINVSGSFALGVLLRCLNGRTRLLAFLTTGFLGAFTTFSTFAVEADRLVKDGHPALAGGYILASVGVGLALMWTGLRVGQRLTPA